MDNVIIYQRIESLDDRERALFAFSMAERMMPLYYDLCNNHTEMYDLGHYRELENLLYKGFQYVSNDIKIEPSTIEEIIDNCVHVLTPDMQEIATTISDLAQKPALCVAYGFDYIINKDIKRWAEECSKETREAPHDLCIRNFCIWIQSAQNRIIAPPKSIETYNKCKWAYRKQSLALATNTWLSNM